MYYNFNKVLNDAKKYNIKIAGRGFGQTYYLREKKAIHMLQSYAGMTHKLTDNQGRPKLDQAIEIVLNLLEEQDNRIKKLEADNYECNNIINDYIGTVNIFNTMINLMLEEIVERKYIFGTIEQAEQYFENKAKESGEIDDK